MSRIMDVICEEASDLRAKEIAARLLKTNLSIEEIAMYTGLSINCIKDLIANTLPI